METPESDHLFAARCYTRTHRFFKKERCLSNGRADIGMVNYMLYLAEVFSYLMERKEKQNA